MSDGPHRSLPMRRGWKHVAECGDNRAFALDEIASAIVPALEQDCRAEINPKFINAISDIFRDQEISLFKDQVRPQLDALRGDAGAGIGRALLDHAVQVSESGQTGLGALVEAARNALTDRAARGARQVEEHYCRKSTAPRAQNVRARIEQAISSAAIDGLARRVLNIESSPPARRSLKQRGLNDGVKF